MFVFHKVIPLSFHNKFSYKNERVELKYRLLLFLHFFMYQFFARKELFFQNAYFLLKLIYQKRSHAIFVLLFASYWETFFTIVKANGEIVLKSIQL